MLPKDRGLKFAAQTFVGDAQSKVRPILGINVSTQSLPPAEAASPTGQKSLAAGLTSGYVVAMAAAELPRTAQDVATYFAAHNRPGDVKQFHLNRWVGMQAHRKRSQQRNVTAV